MTHYCPFGNTGLAFFPLGLGTLWFGRKWPPDNAGYQPPTTKEIRAHMLVAYKSMGNQDGVVMIDTAAAYGDGESRIGEFLRENKEYASKSFIATKWGEDFDLETGVSSIDHSVANLHSSFERSRQRLGRIDLLYLHKTDVSVLRDIAVTEAMLRIRKDGAVRFLGASISDASVLELAVGGDLLCHFDVVQMPASVFLARPDLINALFKDCKAIVLNSPIRKSAKKDPKACYAELLKMPQCSVILTGTRTHLADTTSYADME